MLMTILIILLIGFVSVGIILVWWITSDEANSNVNVNIANANISSNIPKKSSNTPVNSLVKANVKKDATLQKQADGLLRLFDKIPSVPVYLTDQPLLKEGTNTETGLAYTHCVNQGKPEIFVKRVFYEKKNQKQITNVLKHELTHAWQCHRGIMSGHDEEFWKKFRSIGGLGN